MKDGLLFTILMIVSVKGFTQNILEALQLKNEQIDEYVEGELRSSDTLLDLGNGYYEESRPWGEDQRVRTRQAALFNNLDGTKTLAISIAQWDFSCLVDETNFYEIAESGDSIRILHSAELLPHLAFMDFVEHTQIFSVLDKYISYDHTPDLESENVREKALSEIYEKIYLLPQIGTNIEATLRFCDYVPDYLAEMTPEDWTIMENGFRTIQLAYDKRRKRFKKVQSKKGRMGKK